MKFTVDALIVACAALSILCASLLWDERRMRDLIDAGRECRIELAEQRGRIAQVAELFQTARGGQGPVK